MASRSAAPGGSPPRGVLNATVLVAGLGYFVDMFDITLFGVVRTESLNAIGIESALEPGVLLFNMQMIGMLVGGVVWGILGDKKGRLSVLFGSILVYSLANIANGFVTSLGEYAVLRFVAGFGLAGELGAAITLVSEVLDKESRGWGTTIIATLGLLGSVTAAVVGQLLPWNVAYIIGGALGLCLLVARFKTLESGMFHELARSDVKRGDLRLLLDRRRLIRYLLCVLVGVPIYFVTGVLLTFSPEIAAALPVAGSVSAGNALLAGSIGLVLGDLASGALSQVLRSRKKALALFLLASSLLTVVYSQAAGMTPALFYALCFGLGVFVGYWAVFVTVAAEQFGTNLRSTAATTAPNFVRASSVLSTTAFVYLKDHLSIVHSALAVGAVCFGAALLALSRLPETYGVDLDYVEE